MAKLKRLQIAGSKVKVVRSGGEIIGVHAVEKGYTGSRYFMAKKMYVRGKLPETYILVRGVRYYG